MVVPSARIAKLRLRPKVYDLACAMIEDQGKALGFLAKLSTKPPQPSKKLRSQASS